MYIRDVRKGPPIVAPGGKEKIWELFREKDHAGAIAEIVESQLHFHKHTHERYIIMEGEGEVYLDGRTVRVGPYSLVYIRPGTKHKARNIGDKPLTLYVETTPPWSPDDHHLVV